MTTWPSDEKTCRRTPRVTVACEFVARNHMDRPHLCPLKLSQAQCTYNRRSRVSNRLVNSSSRASRSCLPNECSRNSRSGPRASTDAVSSRPSIPAGPVHGRGSCRGMVLTTPVPSGVACRRTVVTHEGKQTMLTFLYVPDRSACLDTTRTIAAATPSCSRPS